MATFKEIKCFHTRITNRSVKSLDISDCLHCQNLGTDCNYLFLVILRKLHVSRFEFHHTEKLL